MSNDKEFKFTHNKLKGLSTTKDEGRIERRDTVVNGLGIRVSYGGTKTFFLRYRHDGEMRRLTLGRFPDISLSEARTIARENLNKISKGIDPKKEKEEKENSTDDPFPTFRKLAETYWSDYAKPTLAEKTRNQYERYKDEYLLPEFGEKHPSEITPEEVKDVMEKAANKAQHSTFDEGDERKGNRTANCIRKTMNSIYSNTSIDIESPARRVQKLKENDPRKNPLSDDQISTFWQALEEEHPTIENYFKILLLLGQRKQETARMKWEDIEDDVWEIPPEDTKNNELHAVPLPPLVQNLLDELEEINGETKWVFYSPHNRNDGPIYSFSNVVERLRNRCSFSSEDFKTHDLRDTVITNLAKLGVSTEIKKRVVNQRVPGVMDKHYDAFEYIPQKREALEQWSTKVAKIVGLDLEHLKEKQIQKLEDEVASLKEALDNEDIPTEVKDEIEVQINTCEQQLNSSDPSHLIVEECKNKIRELLNETVGDERTEEIIQK